ncbi:hypothetical protein POM88_033989 [Heracleum sosnowskyi]|uniref:Exocyst subunit Exo70 family protein n=1 Tax=Heracleum sosnowskyi TaxID=360622 RepID=A0AAD8HIE9_9APIA|nr:hypothetical protein POM88_033989 [Heracleum sosnowskyi]
MNSTVYSSSVSSSNGYELQGSDYIGHGPKTFWLAADLNNIANVSPIASFQNLFAVFDLYKAMLVIFPEIQNMFNCVSSAYISNRARNIINSLETLVRKLVFSFQDVVLNESSNNLSQKGAVYYMTKYTVYYVDYISLYEELITTIIVSWPTQSLGNKADDQFLEASDGTPLQLHMLRIMMSLRINLKRKSILYEDSSMHYVFIMNNFNSILTTMKECPQLDMIGNEYQSKLNKDILQATQDYFSSIWHKVLYGLRHNGLNYKFLFYKGISKKSVRKRFKTFNTAFEKFCETQSTKFVEDTELREQLRNLILNKFLTDYKSFLEKIGCHIQCERHNERYIKYSSEDLQNKIQSLFSEHLISQ